MGRDLLETLNLPPSFLSLPPALLSFSFSLRSLHEFRFPFLIFRSWGYHFVFFLFSFSRVSRGQREGQAEKAREKAESVSFIGFGLVVYAGEKKKNETSSSRRTNFRVLTQRKRETEYSLDSFSSFFSFFFSRFHPSLPPPSSFLYFVGHFQKKLRYQRTRWNN